MPDAPAPSGVPVTINGQPILARPGELVIDAAERHGVYIPRFCYHHRMKPVGMCRMCIVDIDAGRGPALTPACMQPVAADMKVDTESPRTKKAQDGVLEFLLINHPLDCPVCDKGGECPLQDQTLSHGPGESRMVEEKRHYEKPIPISANVNLDRERCILCDRCTRFAKEVAGDPLIHFMNRGNNTEVNTFPDEPFSSYFSGNTVQICPVGALTARPFRFKARPWDLEETESTAATDSVGSRIVIYSSRNRVLRFLGDDSDAVNWGWLSDRERFNFEALNDPERVGEPLVRGPNGHTPVRWAEALAAVASAIAATSPERVALLGGARLSNESQYAWAKLVKGVIGADNVDAQLADGLPPEAVLGLPRATIAEACTPGGTILLLGPDPKEQLGSLYLRLRHAVVVDGATLFELGCASSGLSRHAAHSLVYEPGTAAHLARALVTGESADPKVRAAAAAFAAAAGPLTVVLGRTSITDDPAAIVEAAAVLAEARPDARFLSALTRGNVHGALDMGLSPGLLPGRVSLDEGRAWFTGRWPRVPSGPGLPAAGILAAAALGQIDVLILLGVDPVADFPDRGVAERALERAGLVVAVDLFLTESSGRAHVVLPAAGFAEAEGSFTNLEGRISPLRQRVTPPGTARADWMIAAELARRLEADLGLESSTQIWSEIEAVSALHAGITAEMIEAGREGVLAPLADPSGAPDPAATGRPAMVGFRFEPAAPPPPLETYSLRLTALRRMYDAAVSTQRSPSLAGLAEPTVFRLNPEDFARLGAAPGEVVRVKSRAGAIEAAAMPDPAVAAGAATVVLNLPDNEVNRLLDAERAITDIRVERR
ncbi:MAG: NADH-quinone oxidoreductase subunit NuoG [Acidimicrobiales bacterium]